MSDKFLKEFLIFMNGDKNIADTPFKRELTKNIKKEIEKNERFRNKV